MNVWAEEYFMNVDKSCGNFFCAHYNKRGDHKNRLKGKLTYFQCS
jgi:hypothetical protein